MQGQLNQVAGFLGWVAGSRVSEAGFRVEADCCRGLYITVVRSYIYGQVAGFFVATGRIQF